MIPDYQIAIIGGGAAGFFAAINIARQKRKANIVILEKSSKILSKVAISGGGRCNVTHACYHVKKLSAYYPRGSRHLKKPFTVFNPAHTWEWFEKSGISLKTETDGRIFPVTNDSATIVNFLYEEARSLGIRVLTRVGVKEVQKNQDGNFVLHCSNNRQICCQQVLVSTGGHPKREAYQWLENLGLTIIPPVPSLFTFNIEEQALTQLAGITLNYCSVLIAGSKFLEEGSLLITHWGLSGPAILKLSSRAARELHDTNYQFEILINWVPDYNEEHARATLQNFRQDHGAGNTGNQNPFGLPKRFWQFLLERSGINPSTKWAEVPKKSMNRLVNTLTHGSFQVQGKSTFKEEFVTCGGVSLDEVDFATMESKKVKGLYLAGEVLDIDALTGGFNFQAAWTTAWIAARDIGIRIED